MISAFIQGLSPVLPILSIILILALSLFVAWWSYQHLESIPRGKKVWLILLRGFALFLLVLLLLNPFFTRQETLTDGPRIAVYLDNSQSASIERGEYSGMETFNEILQQFETQKNDEIQYDYFLFDETITESRELTLNGVRTNLNEVMEHLRENENLYRASYLFSDGIVTQGRNPVFAAQNLSIPVITVPLGDTTQVRDIAVADVDYQQNVYTFTRQNIRVEIQQEGYEGEEAVIQLLRDGELIDSEAIEFTAQTSSSIVNFSKEFDEPGFYDFEINVPPKPDEFTDQNNRSSFTIEVLDDKTRVLSLAFEIHPDVSTIRRLIATDQQNELLASTYLGNNRFLGVHPQDMDEDPDLIVLHGLPEAGTELFEWIMNRQIPMVYVATPGSFQMKNSSDYLDLISYYVPNLQSSINVQFESLTGGVSHTVLEVDPINVQRLPNLQTYRGSYQLSPIAQTLLYATFQRTETDIPLLITEDASNIRRASVNAFGWYRYEQNRDTEVREFFTQLFTNLISWSSTPPDRRTLVIESVKSSFTENEPVQVRANLYNERGEPEPEAFIELEIFAGDDNEPLNVFRMNHQQREIYTAELGNYPQGIYRLNATAEKDNRTIGSAEARLNVSQSTIEFLNTRRDDEMLRNIAELTDGLFLSELDFSLATDVINSLILDQPEEEIREEFVYLHRTGLWFFIVLLLLAGEWLLRRSVSLP